MLPDVALLRIFDFYIMDEDRVEAWHTLVHVCREWRIVVFGSPRRLNLQLLCTASSSIGTRGKLDAWPLLPIVVRVDGYENWRTDNIVAALEHKDRVHQLRFRDLPSWLLEAVLANLKQPFPALTDLELVSEDETIVVNPDLFLGGSAPSLRSLLLDYVPFPELPKLLLSTVHLADLRLHNISHSGYISSEAMVTALSTLTRLKRLWLEFESPIQQERKSRRRLPTRTLLPVLTKLAFTGVCEYLEDLVAQLDPSLLYKLDVTFFHQPIIDTPELAHFITRTPKFRAHDEARVIFFDSSVSVASETFDQRLHLEILCELPNQLLSLAQVCSSSFPQVLISGVKRLYIDTGYWRRGWQGGNQWLDILRPFTGVNGLYVSPECTPHIAFSLQELVGERGLEILPALQTLFLQETLPLGHVQDAIGRFVAARQLSGHPVAVSL